MWDPKDLCRRNIRQVCWTYISRGQISPPRLPQRVDGDRRGRRSRQALHGGHVTSDILQWTEIRRFENQARASPLRDSVDVKLMYPESGSELFQIQILWERLNSSDLKRRYYNYILCDSFNIKSRVFIYLLLEALF